MLAVVGGRDFDDKILFRSEMRKMRKLHKFKTLVSGGAKGADTLAEKWAKRRNFEIKIHRPIDPKNPKCYYERNKLIIEDADYLIAFWDGESKGTKLSIDLATKKEIPTHVVNYKICLKIPTRVRIKRENGKVTKGCDNYIGRACFRGGWNLQKSKWANPFTVREYGREKCLVLYEKHVRESELYEELEELSGKSLGCFCEKEEKCHGDVLVNLFKEKFSIVE